MNYINTRLSEIKQNGFDLDLGNLINESFENYKKIALLAGLALTIIILLLMIATIFALGYFIDFENFSQDQLIMDFNTFTPVQIAIYIGATALFAMLFAPFTAGLIKIAHDVETKDEVSFSNIFDCYKGIYLKDLMFSAFVIAVFSSCITVGFQMIHLEFVGTILNYIIGFMSCLTIPLIVFGRLNAIDAILNSILVVSKQPLIIFLALLLAVIGACLGLIAFCLGIFFTLPYLYSMYYAIYKNSVGFDENAELEQIGTFDN